MNNYQNIVMNELIIFSNTIIEKKKSEYLHCNHRNYLDYNSYHVLLLSIPINTYAIR